MKSFRALILALLLVGTSTSQAAMENYTREFIMACTYGVLAGTLVGAASLAFTSRPGENLNQVARGASLGLYAGIVLGLYVVYVVPGLEEGQGEEGIPAALNKVPLLIGPTFRPGLREDTQVDGLQASWIVSRF